MKRAFRILLILAVMLVILGIAGWKYLTSRRLASQVAARLEVLYGGPVRVAGVDVGLFRSSVAGVQLFEKGQSVSGQPWAAIDAVEADVSLVSLLRDRISPDTLRLTGAALTLRFDKQGQLLTRLPDWSVGDPGDQFTVPKLYIERGQITFQKEGATDLTIGGISATLGSKDHHLLLTGAADNVTPSGWGKLTLHGAFDRAAKKGSVTLASDRTIHVTQAMLNQLPFVPATTWRALQLEGDTPLAITLRYDHVDQIIHYHVELEPHATRVHVPAIDLDAAGASGKVVIDDGLVELRGVQGQAFEGTIRTDADLDFRKAVTRLHFSKVDVRGVNMRRLPENWDLPRQIEGRLNGSAWLDILLGTGKPQTRGEGQAEIEDARVGGQPTAEPIRLELHAMEGGFGFRSRKAEPRRQPGAKGEKVPIQLPDVDRGVGRDSAREEMPFLALLVHHVVAGLEQAFQITSWVARWLPDKLALLPHKIALLPRKPGDPGRYVDVDLDMQRVSLARFVKGLGLDLPFAVSGYLSFQVRASIPLDTSGDLKTYRVKGSVEVTQLRMADIELDEVRGNVNYGNGELVLQDLTGRIADKDVPGTEVAVGNFRGVARLQLVPLGDLRADLALDQIPLSRVAAVAGAASHVRGACSGTVAARASAANLQEVNAWDVTAKIVAPQIQALGWSVQDSQTEVRLRQGVLSLADLRIQVEGLRIGGSAELRLIAPFRYQGALALREWDWSAIQRLAPEMQSPVPIAGHLNSSVQVQGTLQPLSVSMAGTGSASDLKVFDVLLKDVRFGWESDDNRLSLKNLHANLAGGKLDGKAVIPLRKTVAGSLDLRLDQLDVAVLSKGLPALPFHMEGRVGGTLKGTFAPATPRKERAVTLDVDLQSPRLLVQGVPTEHWSGTVSYHQAMVDYRLEGKLLGGSFELNGQIPPAGTALAKDSPAGRLRIVRAQLSRVSDVFRMEPGTLPLQGLVDLEVTFRHEGPNRAPVGNGRFVVTRPRWGATELAETLQGQLSLTPGELRVGKITASVGGGSLSGQFALNLQRVEQSWFKLRLEGVEASSVLAPWPSLAGKVEGQVDAHLRGRLGREWSGSGSLVLGRGKIAGIEISDWRLPITWNFSPAEGQGEIHFPESSAQVAMGRVSGQGRFMWGTGLNLEGQIRFVNLELRPVLRPVTESQQLGSGRVTGRFDFAGTNVLSVDDLTGTIGATLAQTQAFQFPALQPLAPFLGIQASSTFEGGELRAHLTRGVLRLDNLSLQGTILQVFVEGNITFAGRLDLDVTGKSGATSLDSTRLRLLGLPLPIEGAISLAVLRRVTGFLSSRLLHLRVTGTVRNPTIRIEPVSLISEGALRFLLNSR